MKQPTQRKPTYSKQTSHIDHKFGRTWWGLQWLNALERIDYSNRLPRGRNYASKGAVKSIEFKKNEIHARVAGTRPSLYKIKMVVPLFSPDEQYQLLTSILNNPILLSRLLNRELPASLLKIARERNIQIFPKSWRDIEMTCLERVAAENRFALYDPSFLLLWDMFGFVQALMAEAALVPRLLSLIPGVYTIQWIPARMDAEVSRQCSHFEHRLSQLILVHHTVNKRSGKTSHTLHDPYLATPPVYGSGQYRAVAPG